MADTVGSLVDKLATVNNKLFLQQELIYEIKRMTFDEFVRKFCTNTVDMQRLYNGLHALSDLNLQRNRLMAEVDQKIVDMIQQAARGEELDDGRNVQRAHKTLDEEPSPSLRDRVVGQCRECGATITARDGQLGVRTSGKMCCIAEGLRVAAGAAQQKT